MWVYENTLDGSSLPAPAKTASPKPVLKSTPAPQVTATGAAAPQEAAPVVKIP